MLNFSSILLSTEDLKRLTDFYSEVFSQKPKMDEETYAGFLVGKSFFSIGYHDKIRGKNPNPDRILFNFETDDVRREFERISKIEGVEVIKEPYKPSEEYEYWIATLADPDGNYFQLVNTWE